MTEKQPKKLDKVKALLIILSKLTIPILTVIRLLKDIFKGGK